MTRLIRAEVLKLVTTRVLLWLGLLILGLDVLVVSLTASQTDHGDLARAGSQRDLLTIASASALIALILGILVSAGEYAHGTAAHTFLVAPVRERVVAAKLVAGAAAALVLAVFSLAVAALLAVLWLLGRSVELNLASRDTLDLVLGVLPAAAIAGVIGVGFGALLRRQTAAIVVALVWLLVGEPLLAVAGIQQYAPGHAIAAVVSLGSHSEELLRFGPGLALSLAYAGVVALLGTVEVRRSDVT